MKSHNVDSFLVGRVKTWISSVAFSASRAEASLSAGMLMRNGNSPVLDGFRPVDGIFSIAFVSAPSVFARICKGPLCFLVVRVLFQLTGLCNGWSLGSVAILTNALKHHFLIKSGAGRRKALAFRASVADVRSPPVTAKAPALCTLVICLTAFAEPTVFGPTCSLFVGVHHMSTAYKTLGRATLV